MKAVALCALLLLGCAQQVKAPHHVELTLHADTDFTPEQKTQLRDAATLWRTTTKGSAHVNLVFDVEPNVASYLEHERLRHHTVSHAPSSDVVVQVIDLLTDRGLKTQTLAITQNDGYGSIRVFFIDDRIKPAQFFSIAAHEIGHAIGFPDLEEPKAIMSRIQSDEPVNVVTNQDLELCKTARYCNE